MSAILNRYRPLAVIPPERVEIGLRMLLYDGVVAQAMATLTGGAFLVAYALALGATPFAIGVISALQPLTQLLQLPAIYLVEHIRYRKLVVLFCLGVSRAFCFALAALPWLVPEPQRLPVFIAVLLAFYAFGTISGVAWNPWIRDLIPAERLSGYMADRLAVTTGVGALLGLVAAFGVDWYQARFDALGIYSLYFVLAGALGLLGLHFIARVPEPLIERNPHYSLLAAVAEPIRDHNFRQLLIFLGSWNFAVNFAAPFFTVYLLQRLGLSMTMVLALALLSQGVNVLFFRLWGRLAERFSYKSVLVEAGPLFIITFILWPLTAFGDWPAFTVTALIVIYALTGISTAGVQLCTGNLALKLAPRGRATAYLAVNALVSGIAATLAPVLGGLAAALFAGEELTFTLRWASRLLDIDTAFTPVTLRGLDFVFLLAFVLGLYSLHRLITIREQGEVEPGTVLPELQSEVRRALEHVSIVGGLRDLFAFPYGRLVDVFNRRRERRVPRPP